MSSLPDPRYQAEFYADIPTKRFVAWLFDAGIVLLLCLLVLPFTAFIGLLFFPFIWLAVSFLYRWSTLSGKSATWGMRLVAIEFRDVHGARFDTGTAFLHTLIYTVAMGTFLLQALSVALILMSERRQSLGDHLIGSVALNRAATH